jgi:hypothetical protein
MHRFLLLVFFLLPLVASAQKQLDTIKVYNITCSYQDGNSFTAWGGSWTPFYPPVACPDNDKSKYIENHKQVDEALKSRLFFWMKLYDTDDHLLYESLKYSDCTVGPFICYHPNGKVKLTGQYDGYKYIKKKGYRVVNCEGKPTGTWLYYDEEGKLVKTENY